MLSAILGDIAGSRFEFMSTQERDVVLFHTACAWTDDTVCTSAVSEACQKISAMTPEDILNPENEVKIEQVFTQALVDAVHTHPMAGYGQAFHAWAGNPRYARGDSAANGCLMRVSPIVLYFDSWDVIEKLGYLCTRTSHDHPDAHHSVKVYLEMLFYLRNQRLAYASQDDDLGADPEVTKDVKKVDDLKDGIRAILNKHDIALKTLEDYHLDAGYWILAKDTLPRAVSAYLESTSFETTLKNILYIGSDTDTTSAIGATLAELSYQGSSGVTQYHLRELYRYFDFKAYPMLRQVLEPYVMDGKPVLHPSLVQAKIKELYRYQCIDQTATYDPLEIPSDEDYYKAEYHTWKFKLKKLFGMV